MKDTVVNIKNGKYRYRYDPDTKTMNYLGPVGCSPEITEGHFLKMISINTVDEEFVQRKEIGGKEMVSVSFNENHRPNELLVLRGKELLENHGIRVPDEYEMGELVYYDDNLVGATFFTKEIWQPFGSVRKRMIYKIDIGLCHMTPQPARKQIAADLTNNISQRFFDEMIRFGGNFATARIPKEDKDLKAGFLEQGFYQSFKERDAIIMAFEAEETSN
jgi:hypothetical protein